jgi:hypothetical protein
MSAPNARPPRDAGALLPWLALALLWLAHGLATRLPTMHAWGLNLNRFLPAWTGWGLWAVSGLVLLPPVGRAATRALERAGAALRGRMAVVAALALTLAVFALPDRTWLTGDFMLRQGTAETGGFEATFVNALPVEVLLDRWLPTIVRPDFGADPSPATRVLEALLAGALALAAAALAREWSVAGPARAAAVAIVAGSGALVAFTGLGKPTALVALLVVACLLAATRLERTARGGLAFGLALGLALLTHRAALMLAPLGVLVGVRAVREVRAGRMARMELIGAIALPLVVAAFVAPRLARIVAGFDLPRHLAPAGLTGGVLASLVAPLRLLDLANVLIVLVPLAPIALLARAPRTPREPGPQPPGATATLVLALSALPVFLLVHPIQGIFRDLEVFVPAGIAIALACARTIGLATGRERLPAWLVPAMLAATIVPSAQWLIHFGDPVRGIDRARRFASEPPASDPSEIAQLWDLLAYREFRARNWPGALVASRAAVASAPSKRAEIMWAMTRSFTGDDAGAESLYVALADRYPDDPVIWLGLAGAAMRRADTTEALRAVARLNSYGPGSPERRVVQRTVRAFPEMWPALGGAAGP